MIQVSTFVLPGSFEPKRVAHASHSDLALEKINLFIRCTYLWHFWWHMSRVWLQIIAALAPDPPRGLGTLSLDGLDPSPYYGRCKQAGRHRNENLSESSMTLHPLWHSYAVHWSYLLLNHSAIFASSISAWLMNWPSVQRSCSLIDSTLCLHFCRNISWPAWNADYSEKSKKSIPKANKNRCPLTLSCELCSHIFSTRSRPPVETSFHSFKTCSGTRYVPSTRGCMIRRKLFIWLLSPLLRATLNNTKHESKTYTVYKFELWFHMLTRKMKTQKNLKHFQDMSNQEAGATGSELLRAGSAYKAYTVHTRLKWERNMQGLQVCQKFYMQVPGIDQEVGEHYDPYHHSRPPSAFPSRYWCSHTYLPPKHSWGVTSSYSMYQVVVDKHVCQD